MGSNGIPRPFPDLPSHPQLCLNSSYLDYDGAPRRLNSMGGRFAGISEVARRAGWVREQDMIRELQNSGQLVRRFSWETLTSGRAEDVGCETKVIGRSHTTWNATLSPNGAGVS